jgi:CheY-like chemotaxis protein
MSSPARIASNPAQREVVRILALAYGDDKRAADAVSRALSESGRRELPEGATALFEFIAREMVPTLTADLGPRVTIALLAELEAFRDSPAHLAPSGPPAPTISEAPVTGPRRRVSEATDARASSPRTRALIVDADRLRRANIARALLRARCDVTAVESAAELRAALAAEAPHDIAVVDVGAAAAAEILDAFASLAPDLPLVACASDPDSTERVLAARSVKTFVACGRNAAPDDIAALAAKQLATRPRR